MRATPFKERRLPKVGDKVFDTCNKVEVTVTEVQLRNLMVKGGPYNSEYGRGQKYFNW